MITAVRSTAIAALLAAVTLAGAACTQTAGPLGTPASPAVSADPSDEPAPSDVAPGTPGADPTIEPSAAPTEAPSGSATTSASPSLTPTPTPAPVGTTIVRAYFILGSFTGNEGLVPVLREVPETRGVASAAMAALLAGPRGAELQASPAMSTAIPDGTTLRGVTVENGVATVDLSGDFATGGGTFSVMARLAQVVYTLTQFSTVDAVLFELDGVPVTTFSSEGLILDGPVGRADARDMLPAIFLDRPAWGASAGNPARISGLANVFEATFRVQVLDAGRNVLADEQVMATCGTGCWGTFKQDVAYSVTKAQYGTLRVFEPSAKDGLPINVVEYRVWLTP
ncbi:MAG TPA: GerMN domain-containing protein [Candidatus Limnocylindrales bacterium]|nr:GerMN domain-containing protein [Candidatus Limnocylindrales bacterium]